MAQFWVHEAKTHLSCLIADALAGGEVVITRGGVPVVRLVPVKPHGSRVFGAFEGKIAMDDSFNDALPADEQGGWNAA